MKDITDLGLDEATMQRLIDGARVAFGNDYPSAPTEAPAPRQPAKQRRKVKYARQPPERIFKQ
jgi:hypothetical protein